MASHTSAVMHLTSLPFADVRSVFSVVVWIVSVAVYRFWLGYTLCGLHFLKNLDALVQFLSLQIVVILSLIKVCIVASFDLLMALLAAFRLVLHCGVKIDFKFIWVNVVLFKVGDFVYIITVKFVKLFKGFRDVFQVVVHIAGTHLLRILTTLLRC